MPQVRTALRLFKKKVLVGAQKSTYADRMKHDVFVVIYLVVMVALIIGLDVWFLRDHLWWRLATNVGIVVVFATVYLLFFRISK